MQAKILLPCTELVEVQENIAATAQFLPVSSQERAPILKTESKFFVSSS
jgi:hypothetical protein